VQLADVYFDVRTSLFFALNSDRKSAMDGKEAPSVSAIAMTALAWRSAKARQGMAFGRNRESFRLTSPNHLALELGLRGLAT